MADIGKGTTVEYASLGGSDFASLGDVFDTGTPEVEYAEVKTTHYGTPGNLHTHIVGWGDGGTLEVQMNFDATTFDAAHDIKGVEKSWEITEPGGGVWSFDGFIKKIGAALPNEDRMVAKITIRVTSDVTFTAPA